MSKKYFLSPFLLLTLTCIQLKVNAQTTFENYCNLGKQNSGKSATDLKLTYNRVVNGGVSKSFGNQPMLMGKMITFTGGQVPNNGTDCGTVYFDLEIMYRKPYSKVPSGVFLMGLT